MNKDGKYGYFYDKPAKEKAEKNKTRALAVSNQEAFDGAIRELKAQRKLSVSNVNSLLNDFAPEDMFGPTRVSQPAGAMRRVRLCSCTRSIRPATQPCVFSLIHQSPHPSPHQPTVHRRGPRVQAQHRRPRQQGRLGLLLRGRRRLGAPRHPLGRA